MKDGLNISILSGKAKEIGVDIDSTNINDNKLSWAELSIFFTECERCGIDLEKEAWFKEFGLEIKNQLENLKKNEIQQDAIKDYKEDVLIRENFSLEKFINFKKLGVKNSHIEHSKTDMCTKMYKKWSDKFESSNLDQAFFENLYEVLDILKVEISDSEWDKNNYISPKEEAFEKVIAIFAGESQLNSRKIGYVNKEPIFYGIFQLSSEGLEASKKWASAHPDVKGMKNVKSNMTISKYRNLSASQQLDYLVAYIGASREASKISSHEKLSPAKLWSMIKLPNLNENIASKKDRRNRSIVQQGKKIKLVFTDNKIPYGIKQ